MSQVLGVHGIAQEQLGRNQLLDEWRPGLGDGVEAAAGRSAPVPTFDMCFYGDVFLPAGAQGERQPAGKGTVNRDPLAAPLSADDAQFLADVVAEVEAVMPDLGPAMGAPRVPAVWQPLARRLTRRMDGGTALRFLAVLGQVKAYLDDEIVARRIRDRFLAQLARVGDQAGGDQARGEPGGGDLPAVVIGHSLGSVVVVDALRRHPEQRVSTLITVGSPLGMRAVQARLRHADGPARPTGAMGNVARWVNVYDPGDPVAAAGGLSLVWPAVEDYTVGNGTDPHAVRRYLGKAVVGRAVLDGVASAGSVSR